MRWEMARIIRQNGGLGSEGGMLCRGKTRLCLCNLSSCSLPPGALIRLPGKVLS